MTIIAILSLFDSNNINITAVFANNFLAKSFFLIFFNINYFYSIDYLINIKDSKQINFDQTKFQFNGLPNGFP